MKRFSLAGFVLLLCSLSFAGATERRDSGIGSGTRFGPATYGSDPEKIYATRPPFLFYHDVGLLAIQVSNLGVFGNPWGLDDYGARWRDGEYLYAAGVWIGAVASDDQPYVSTSTYELEILPSADSIDTVYESYEGIVGGNRNGFSLEADDDGDGVTDEEFHNGKDDDRDGAVDEDFAAISEQMYSSEYWDYEPRTMELNPDHRPLNVKVRQRSMAWSVQGIDEFVGVELEVTNDSLETLRDVYIGLFADADVGPREHDGYYTDDGGHSFFADTTVVDPTLAECDSLLLRVEMAYMYDIPDDGLEATGGDVEGFFGILYLGSTADPTGRAAPSEERLHAVRVFSSSAPYPVGEPRNDRERYDALSTGAIPSGPTGQPNDYRMLVSVGPFPSLGPLETLRLDFAFVVGEGYYDEDSEMPRPELGSDGFPDDHSLVANAIRARIIYEGRWKDIDGSTDTGVDGRETCIRTEPGDPFVWASPCNATMIRIFDGTACDDPDSWVDNDCDPCTPNPFHDGCAGGGCESLIRWYTPPATAAAPDDTGSTSSAADAMRLIAAGVPSGFPVRLRLVSHSPAACGMRIYDVRGRLVLDLGTRRSESETTDWTWDGKDRLGRDALTGVYFARAVRDDGISATERFVLLER